MSLTGISLDSVASYRSEFSRAGLSWVDPDPEPHNEAL
jgi:hypothetical protein